MPHTRLKPLGKNKQKPASLVHEPGAISPGKFKADSKIKDLVRLNPESYSNQIIVARDEQVKRYRMDEIAFL